MITFYHGHGSAWSWRVWLALEHLGLPYDLKVLSFANQETRTPQFKAINPRHQVPVIVDDDLIVYESAVIVEYLADRYPQGPNGHRLFPADVAERMRVRRLIREAESYLDAEGLLPVIEELFYAKPGTVINEERIRESETKVAEELKYLEGELGADWFAGELGAADLSIYPFLAYLRRVEKRARADYRSHANSGHGAKGAGDDAAD